MSFTEDPRKAGPSAQPGEDPTGSSAGGTPLYEDPTQVREVGAEPYEDPTQEREIGEEPFEDPTQSRVGELLADPTASAT
jgi:hypothetical protein